MTTDLYTLIVDIFDEFELEVLRCCDFRYPAIEDGVSISIDCTMDGILSEQLQESIDKKIFDLTGVSTIWITEID